MSRYIVNRYSGLLTDDSAIELFKKITEIDGGIAQAARDCGISRKAVYDWDVIENEIKLETKQRILSKALELFPDYSLKYLSGRSYEDLLDILQSYFDFLYQKALKQKDGLEFIRIVQSLQDQVNAYAGITYGRLDYKISDMFMVLQEYGKTLKTDWKPKLIQLSEKYSDLPTHKHEYPDSALPTHEHAQSIYNLANRNMVKRAYSSNALTQQNSFLSNPELIMEGVPENG